MNYEFNVEAYKLFLQIEVGIREFLIMIIKENGVKDWFNTFVGQIQRNTLSDVINRINDSNIKNLMPEIEDLYIYKLDRVIRTLDSLFYTDQLYHPFYYLNWNDLENLIRMKSNITLIDKSIGKQNRKVLADNLSLLSSFRNDIAHSRLITETDLRIIRASFLQITGIIPDFNKYVENQTKEEKVGEVINKLKKIIEEIDTIKILELDYIEDVISFIKRCLNSFWLNSLKYDLISYLDELNIYMIEYYKYRKQPGGLLQIQKLKDHNKERLQVLKNIINNGKV